LSRAVVVLVGASLAVAASFMRAPAPAHASVVLALGLEDLTRKADVIALAVPTEHQSRMQARSGLIVTDVSLRVEQSLKGTAKAGQTLVATLLGGELDGVALAVPGEASLPLGQKLLVFLQHSKSGELRAVGMSQGVLTLSDLRGTTMVMPGGNGAALVQPGSDGALRDAPAALMEPQPLGAVLDRIRALVAAQAKP